MMLCEKYNCTMSEAACVKRQRLHTAGYNRYWGERDPGCQDCAQGKEIMNKYEKGEIMTEDQAKYNQSSAKDQQKQCRHCGLMVAMAEAGVHFYRSKNTPDGFESTCKQCKAKMATERRRAKKAARTGVWKTEKKSAPAPPKKTDTIKKNDHVIDWDEVDRELNKLGRLAKEGRLETKLKQAMTAEIKEMERHAETKPKQLTVVELDDLVKELCDRAGYPHLYADLEKVAAKDMRPPHLQLLYMLSLFSKMPAAGVDRKEVLH